MIFQGRFDLKCQLASRDRILATNSESTIVPGMADKKLAKKLAKMSEEERTAFLEQQRLAEEEFKKKKEEGLSAFLKVDLNTLKSAYIS